MRPTPSAFDSGAPDHVVQGAVLAAMAGGKAIGECGPLARIETHMSHVFLGRERAYKLARARRHPFADLSSEPARKAACEAEFEINRKLAPGLYEAVLPLTRNTTGKIVLSGAGAPVDWVVIMRRIPDGALFAELAESGRLTAPLVVEAVEAIHRLHETTQPRRDSGHAEDYHRIVAGLRETAAQGAPHEQANPPDSELFEQLDSEVARLAPLIEARREAGWVRRGHGDLHLRNICLFEGRVTLFDALAFDPALATADVLYDLAFLLMDLRARGLPDHANRAMNLYWNLSDQPEAALALLPLFMALRATVRMAVAAEAGDPVEAASYRRLAGALLSRTTAELVAVGGLSGTGKSTLAAAIAPHFAGPCGARLLRSDVIRKQDLGIADEQRLPIEAYGEAARAGVYRKLAGKAVEALAAGASAIADATFGAAPARALIERAAGSHRFTGLWLRAPTAVRVERVTARYGDASDATTAIAAAQVEPEALAPSWRMLDARASIEVLADEVLRLLEPSLEARLHFLNQPSAWPVPTSSVITRETHMSWVFLVGDRAYKLKKPVRLPYLDFSTLKRREAACRSELLLNRRLAPDVYLGTIPLIRGPNGLSLGGEGEIVDWLVEMRRLDEADTLEARLTDHSAADRDLDRLARRLTGFYRHARPVHLSRAAYRRKWRAALARHRQTLLDPRLPLPHDRARRIDSVLRRFMSRRADLLDARVRARRIVDAHGDLRPEHIWMSDPIRIIDCLEFNPSFRAMDPMDEIAFLDLECERLGALRAGARIRHKVLAALGERHGEALYRFYRCQRAMLRAQLSIAHLLEPEPRTPGKWPPLAAAYLRIAGSDALRLERMLKIPGDR